MSHRRLRSFGPALLATSLLALPGCDEASPDGGRPGDELDKGAADGGDPVGGVEADTFATNPRVLVYAFDPDIESAGGQNLSESQGWNDPHMLTFEYRDAVREATWGAVDYQVEAFYRIKDFPLRTDGERYDELSYLRCLNEGGDACLPDSPYMTDLARYADIFEWCEAAEDGVEEVWVFGAPWFGMPESQMAGDGAYWLNSTPLETGCDTPLVIMAFSYHVPVSNMLHNLGHRIESHLDHAFSGWPAAEGPSPWEQFSRRAENSSEPECGNVHWPPHTGIEYGYSDAAEVVSGCDRWLDYPDHEGVEAETVSCGTWGCEGDTQRNYMQWWIQHLPHREGEVEGFSTNWQRYIFDYRSHM